MAAFTSSIRPAPAGSDGSVWARHPDMPPQAFADLWASLQAGLPWTGMVKNRNDRHEEVGPPPAI